MPLIYITGPSCAGKSTLQRRLATVGYEAYDADESICAWHNNTTGEKVNYPHNMRHRDHDWQDDNTFLIDEHIVKKLYTTSRTKTVFILGNATNEIEIAKKYFDKVLCLEIDEETMAERLLSRTTNRYGKDPDQMAVVRKWFKPTMDRYRLHGAIMIDATQPLEDVVNQVLKAIKIL